MQKQYAMRWLVALVLLMVALTIAACGVAQPAAAPTQAPAVQPTEAPAAEQPANTPAPTAAPAATLAAEATQAPAGSGKPKIAYIQTGPFEYYQYGTDGVKMAAEKLGVDLLLFNSDLKPEKEIANVEDAIQQGVDGIVLFSVGRASEEAALAAANKADIPVALLYGYAPELVDKGAAFLQADVNASGGLAGKWVAENVKSGKVAIIQGMLGRGDAEAYTESFKKALAANPDLKVVAEPEGGWDRAKAVAAMEDILTKHPDLAAAFIQNEDMALGALSVIKDRGADVKIVSQNGSPNGLDAVKKGDIAATVGWSPSEEAQMALARLMETIRTGKAPEPKLCNTPLLVMTAENVDQAHPWVPTAGSTAVAIKAQCANTAQPAAMDAKPLRIAYIQTGPFEYYQYGTDGAKMAADKLGVELVLFNSDLKPEKEIANVEDAIQKGVDGIVLFSVGRASEEAALVAAKKAGIPVAVLYGYAPELEDQGAVFLQADVNSTGKMAGEWLAKNLDSGKVAIIQGMLGRGDAEAYTEGFKKALAANSNLKVVAEPEGGWDRAKAVAAMEDLLTRYPDLAGAFIQNEDMALGAMSVIKDRGADVKIVSQNGSPNGLDAVKKGEISATVGWSPSEEAQIALSRLVKTIRTGKAPEPKLCNTPLLMATAANADQAHPWVPTAESTLRALDAKCANE